VEKIHSDDGIATEVGEHKKVNEDEQETTQPSTDETEQSLVDRETCVKPVSVNYHFTRQCNYSCGFCFHTAKTSFVFGYANEQTTHDFWSLIQILHFLTKVC
jgi:uncharacterized radical SAM superfamily Fe-S cluster-containing enzyme